MRKMPKKAEVVLLKIATPVGRVIFPYSSDRRGRHSTAFPDSFTARCSGSPERSSKPGKHFPNQDSIQQEKNGRVQCYGKHFLKIIAPIRVREPPITRESGLHMVRRSGLPSSTGIVDQLGLAAALDTVMADIRLPSARIS